MMLFFIIFLDKQLNLFEFFICNFFNKRLFYNLRKDGILINFLEFFQDILIIFLHFP